MIKTHNKISVALHGPRNKRKPANKKHELPGEFWAVGWAHQSHNDEKNSK